MAILELTSQTPKLWLMADRIFDLLPGEPVTEWFDQSGFGNDFGAPGGQEPIYRPGTLQGRAVVEFDPTGAADTMDGPNLSTFLTAAAGTVFVLYKADAISTNDSVNINNNVALLNGSASNSPGLFLRNTSPVRYYSLNVSGGSGAATFVEFTLSSWRIAIWVHGSSSLGAKIDDPFDTSASIASGSSDNLGAARLGRNYQASPKYFDGMIAEVIAFDVALSLEEQAKVVNYLKAKWLDRGDTEAQTRDTLGRALWRRHRPETKVELVSLPLLALDADILDTITVSHPGLLHPAGDGAGLKPWERDVLDVEMLSEDPNTKTVSIIGDRLKGGRLHTYWETAVPSKIASKKNEGVAICGATHIRSFTRFNKANLVRPADGLIGVIPDGEEGRENPAGLINEDPGINRLSNPAFASNLTSWTAVAGGGGATIVAETTTGSFVFADTVTLKNALMTQGNPASGENRLHQTTPSIGGGLTVGRVSIYHKDDSGAQLFWRLQRASDNKYWNAGGGTWDVASVDNSTPISTVPVRYKSGSIDMSAATTYNLSLIQQAGGTVSRKNRIYYADVKDNIRWHSTILASQGSALAEGHTWIQNNAATGRIVNASRGTAVVRVTPFWNSADLGTSDITDGFTVFFCEYGVYDSFRLWYRGLTGAWTFTIRYNNNTYHAEKVISVTAGTEVVLACRWIGADGELNLAPYTGSVFVNGVKGTDVVGAALPIESSTSSLHLGSTPFNIAAVARALNGAVREIEFLSECLTDQEIAARAL